MNHCNLQSKEECLSTEIKMETGNYEELKGWSIKLSLFT